MDEHEEKALLFAIETLNCLGRLHYSECFHESGVRNAAEIASEHGGGPAMWADAVAGLSKILASRSGA